MKMLSSSVERNGDNFTVRAAFRNRKREPVDVKLFTAKSNEPAGIQRDLWSGDVAEVMGLFGGIAEIAWKMGWRPRGLEGGVAHFVKKFNIPPEEGA